MAGPNRYAIKPLQPTHDRASFSCGQVTLDTYLRQQAGQDIRRRANAVFVITSVTVPDRILGYYTLCATALQRGEIPDAALRHLPRYPLVAATLIGRLAISHDEQGKGLGSVLLTDALKRAYVTAGTVGSCMVVVDALDDKAAAFYSAHGFTSLSQGARLILPMRTIGTMVETG